MATKYLRLLKSGSGSGTGGGGVGTIGTKPGITPGAPGGSYTVAIIIIVSAIVAALTFIAIIYVWFRRRNPHNFKPESFESKVERERNRVTRRRSSLLVKLRSSTFRMVVPKDGLYVATYFDVERKKVKLIYDLKFKDDGNGYAIFGKASKSSHDVFLNIQEGYARYDGKIFWKGMLVASSPSTATETDDARIILTRGTLDFNSCILKGMWMDSDGLNGAYSSFHKLKVKETKDHEIQEKQRLQGMNEC